MTKMLYGPQFDNEWRVRKITGYQVIKDLHEKSRERYFLLNESNFSAIFHSKTNLQQLKQDLLNNESLNLKDLALGSKC